jgi:hypothetical protein
VKNETKTIQEDAKYRKALKRAEAETEECGQCGSYHRVGYAGDCRNDAERFASPEDYMQRTMGIKSRE